MAKSLMGIVRSIALGATLLGTAACSSLSGQSLSQPSSQSFLQTASIKSGPTDYKQIQCIDTGKSWIGSAKLEVTPSGLRPSKDQTSDCSKESLKIREALLANGGYQNSANPLAFKAYEKNQDGTVTFNKRELPQSLYSNPAEPSTTSQKLFVKEGVVQKESLTPLEMRKVASALPVVDVLDQFGGKIATAYSLDGSKPNPVERALNSQSSAQEESAPKMRVASLDSEAATISSSIQSEPIHITIKKGSTLSQIAKEYRLSVNEIASQNNISDPNKIYAGQKLSITIKKASEQQLQIAAPAREAPSASPLEQVAATHSSIDSIVEKVTESSNQQAASYSSQTGSIAAISSISAPSKSVYSSPSDLEAMISKKGMDYTSLSVDQLRKELKDVTGLGTYVRASEQLETAEKIYGTKAVKKAIVEAYSSGNYKVDGIIKLLGSGASYAVKKEREIQRAQTSPLQSIVEGYESSRRIPGKSYAPNLAAIK